MSPVSADTSLASATATATTTASVSLSENLASFDLTAWIASNRVSPARSAEGAESKPVYKDVLHAIAQLHKASRDYGDSLREQERLRDELRALQIEMHDKDCKLELAAQSIRNIVGLRAIKVVYDDAVGAYDAAVRDWPEVVRDYVYDVFISYRVRTESALANELYLQLQLYKSGSASTGVQTPFRNKVFLDSHLLRDGEDWRKGFLEGLKKSRLIVLFVSAGALEGFRRSNLWVDNVLLEWETALIASKEKKCAILPVFIDDKNGVPFDFAAVENDLKADVYPSERPDIEDSVQCYLSAKTIIKKVLETPGIFIRDRSHLKQLIPRIESTLSNFLKEDTSSLQKARNLLGTMQTTDPWNGRECRLKNLSQHDLEEFCMEVLPYNSTWKIVIFHDLKLCDAYLKIVANGVALSRKSKTWKVKIIQFSDCPYTFFEPSAFQHFTWTENATFKTLSFELNSIGPNQLTEIISGLKDCSLKSIKFISNPLKNAGVEILADALQTDLNLTSLTLKDVGIEGVGIEYLANALKENKSLYMFSLEACVIGDSGASLFADALKVNSTLKQLKLRSNDIGKEGGERLFEMLKFNKSLLVLKLGNNRIPDDCVEVIAAALIENKTLQCLDLYANWIGGKTVITLAESLKKNESLSTLVLSNISKLENTGVKSLADMLEVNRSLIKLRLENVGIDDDGVKLLCIALEKNKTLELLDLEKNDFGDKGAKYIANMLKKNNTLEKLYLAGTPEKIGNISNEGIKSFASALESKNKTLKALSLGCHRFNSEGVRIFSSALKANSKLTISLVDAMLVSADADLASLLHVAAERGFLEVAEVLIKQYKVQVDYKNQTGDTPLHIACSHGNFELAKLFLECNADTEIKDAQQNLPIHLAAQENSEWDDTGAFPLVVSELIKHNVRLDTVNASGSSALILAVRAGKVDVVRVLCESTANKELKDKDGFCALHYAAKNGNFELVKLLVENGSMIDMKVTKQGTTALFLAATAEIVEYLCKKGSDTECRNNVGERALYACIKSDISLDEKLKIVKVLLEHGCKVDAFNTTMKLTALNVALRNGYENIVDFLLSKTSINGVPEGGETPLTSAAQSDNFEIFDKLIRQDADIHVVNPDGSSAFSAACISNSNEIFEYLLDKGVNVNTMTQDCTPLKKMCGYPDRRDMVVKLLDLGADIELAGKDKCTPLMTAIESSAIETVRLLLERGANVNAQNSNNITPLIAAAKKADMEDAVRLLLDSGADIALVDNNKNSALHVAVLNKNYDTAKLLINRNVDVNLQNIDGNTPLHLLTRVASQEKPVTTEVEKDSNTESVLSLMKLLFSVGANKNLQNNVGCTALNSAVINRCHLEIIKLCIEEQCDLNLQDNDLFPPLMNAFYFEYNDAGKLLLESGADATLRNNTNRTALHLATLEGSVPLETIKLLCEKNSDVNARNTHNSTPFLLAAERCGVEIVKYLVEERNADITAIDNDGDNALHCAASSGRLDNITYLFPMLDCNALNAVRQTVIEKARDRGQHEAVELLLSLQSRKGAGDL